MAESHSKWLNDRLIALKRKDGLAALIGEYPITADGEYKIGSDFSSDLLINNFSMPTIMGKVVASDNTSTISFVSTSGESAPLLTKDGKVHAMQMETVVLTVDVATSPKILKVYDEASDMLQQLTALAQLPAFPYNPVWSLTGYFKPDASNPSAGTFHFVCPTTEEPITLHVECGITPTTQKLDMDFGDLTNGMTTFGGGRVVEIVFTGEEVNVKELNEEDGEERQVARRKVTADFNYGRSPVCAFAVFNTCHPPLSENCIQVAVEAGEKSLDAA